MRTIQQLMDLSGRRALVTGGAGHIGKASSAALLELGCTVGLLDRDAASIDDAVASLRTADDGRVIGVRCDLQDEQATRVAIRDAIQRLGGLDVLIHAAAFVGDSRLEGWAVPFEEQSVAAFDAALRVNLTAAMVLAQEVRQALASSGHGSMILVGSIYGVVGPDFRLYEGTPMQNPAGYAASKGGLLQLVRYLATLLAPAIRVNAVSPGGVWRNQHERFHERYRARTPLGRMASEEDLKGAIAYLASDLSAYVTGQNLVVDGGWTAW
jgi:NAD(P)-dependent dehydrogenase (short-subunit alcohol dehydrogenase family)